MEPLPADEVDAALADLPGWVLAADGRSIGRDFRFADFPAAFGFMTAVALGAQALDHHPDWSNSYSAVSMRLTTHDVGGVTDLDLKLARQAGHVAERLGLQDGPSAAA